MDALTAGLRDLLVAEGASPELALTIACEEVPRYRGRIKREFDTNEAQRLLPLVGAVKAAEQLKVCRATIYNRNRRRKSKQNDTVRQEPA